MLSGTARHAAMARDRGMRDQQCDSIAGLMERLGVRSGGALLARLGCAGNTEALWETLAREIALALMPDDEIAALASPPRSWPAPRGTGPYAG